MTALTWLLDFDDTLASGMTTWGVRWAMPKLMRQHGLSCDPLLLQQAMLTAQEQFNLSLNPDPTPVLDDLFDRLGWPRALQSSLLDDLRTAYRPALFEDTMPFLRRLNQAGRRLYVVSNNPHAPVIARQLGIHELISQFFTPRLYPGAQPKPHPSLWRQILAEVPQTAADRTVMIGDDPWSDGVFAANCGLACWIVDRDDRFGHLPGSYWRVRSLLDIPAPDGGAESR